MQSAPRQSARTLSNPKRRYMIALGTPPSATAREEIELAKFAEAQGFEGISTVERIYNGHIMLTAIGLSTSKLTLLSSSGIHYRTPTMTAIDAATIDELSNGRLILGLVPGSPLATAPYGLPFEREHIITKMREHVEIVRRLLAGERVSFDGKVYKNIKDAQLWFKPPRAHVPIMLGARGPQMCQLAGEVADGIFGGAVQPPEYIKRKIEDMHRGAKKAGRDTSELEVIGSVFYFDTADDARRWTTWWMNYQPMFDDVWSFCNLMPLVEKIRKCYREGDPAAALELVDEKIVKRFAIWGKREDCEELLDRLWSVGVTRLRFDPKGTVGTEIKRSTNESVKKTMRRIASIASFDR